MTAPSLKRAALLGVFAILFQALVFGWHHHDLTLAARGASPALSAPASGSTGSPTADADECEICIVIHHQAASPLAFIIALAPPVAAAAIVPPSGFILVADDHRSAFARAPPQA
jgi:hypothetical protein